MQFWLKTSWTQSVTMLFYLLGVLMVKFSPQKDHLYSSCVLVNYLILKKCKCNQGACRLEWNPIIQTTWRWFETHYGQKLKRCKSIHFLEILYVMLTPPKSKRFRKRSGGGISCRDDGRWSDTTVSQLSWSSGVFIT